MPRMKAIAIIILLSFILNFSCMGIKPAVAEETTPPNLNPPRITSIFPNFGDAGREITILGSNFQIGDTSIKIGEVQIREGDPNWVDLGGNWLKVKIPEGISQEVITIEVSTNAGTAKLTDAFTFSTATTPTITSIRPNTGGLRGGTPVTLLGSNFRQDFGSDGAPKPPEVKFGEVLAEEVIVKNTREIIVIAPPATTEGKVKIFVKNPDQDTWTDSGFEFEYIAEGKLARILNITPNQGTMDGGTPISIRGVNFPTNKSEYKNLEILIGDVAVTEIDIEAYGYVDDDNQFVHHEDENGNKIYIINAKTGSSQFAGKQDVQLNIVWADDHPKAGKTEVAILPGGFTYYIPKSFPKIEEVINTSTGTNVGPINGGHIIRIRGTGFEAGAEVYFGDKAAEVTALTGTLITVKLPKGDIAGPVDVLVRNKTQGEITGEYLKVGGFTYRGTSMQISTITPNYASTAEKKDLVITGENFNEDILANTKVYFEYLAPDPDRPGEQIIRRESLNKVHFDPQLGTLLTAETPDHPASGWKDLVVENSYGRAILRKAFEFRSPDIQPVIEAVVAAVYEGETPPSPIGSTTGGTPFIIHGNNFVTGSKVYVGGQLAKQIDVKSFKEIEAISPAGEPGWQDVTVESPTGKSATMKAWNRLEPDPGEGQRGFYYYSNPSIHRVDPNRGSVSGGNIITITGEQFYPGATVSFGGTAAKEDHVIVVDQNTIKVRLPALPEGQEPGIVQVEVCNSDEQKATWDGFLYKKPDQDIKIFSVIPNIGKTSGGTEVIIRGESFSPDVVVHFGWEEAQVISLRRDELIVIAPPNPVGKYDITVSNHFDTGTAIWGPFEYVDPSSAPKIEAVFPHMGPTSGGTKVLITGSGFWPGAKVWVGGRPATDVEAFYTYIEARTPPTDPEGKVGPADIMVMNPDGGIAVLARGYTYKNPDSNPVITEISPKKVVTTGGTIVTIIGSDFRKGRKVYFGSIEAEILDFLEPTTIVVKAPPHPRGEEGLIDVTVLNTDGGVAQVEKGIEYVFPKSEPEITKISPSEGPAAGGTTVVIEGDGFRKNDTEVYFGGRRSTQVTVISYDRLEVITPPGSPGVVDVTVINASENSLGSFTARKAFTYKASNPIITNIAPNQGSYLGGTLVTITGQGFTTVGAKVYIGDWEAKDVKVLNPETITFLTPAIAEKPEDLPELKWWDVKVINADSVEAIKKDAFRYLFPDSNPKIISIDPLKGSTAGGMPLIITGTDFRLRAKVVIGGKDAQVLMIDDSPGEGKAQIIVKTPPHTPGDKDVVVINYEGAISNTVTFEYVAPLSFPEISTITPKQGPTVGDTEVIITGIGFKEDARVWFGMNEAPKVDFIDYKTLKVITPTGNEGNVDVLVLNPDMGQAILSNAFRYIKAKEFVLKSITPNEGSANGGTAITIIGGPFDQGATVQIGGNPAIEVIVLDANTITAITPPGELGWQEVRVKNPDGGWAAIAAGFFYIKPRTAPDTPGWLDTERKDHETIQIEWEPAEFANYYEIWVSETRSGKYRFLDQTTRTIYYATSLDPSQTYYFQVRAINELGVSDFSYYNYARTGSGRKQETDLVPEKIVMEIANGSILATIASANALAGIGYRLDFNQEQHKAVTRKVVRISKEALSKSYLPITIEAPGITLSIPTNSLYMGLLGNEDAYAEIILLDLGQQEAERALKELPRGSRIISPVYALEWQILSGTKGTPQSSFYQQINLTMKYSMAITPGKQVSLYTYNPATGRWVNTGAANDRHAPQLSIGISSTGRFMLVEH